GGSLLLWSPAQLFMDTCFGLMFHFSVYANAFSK
ncbi:putative membrane protein, partial [Acinetobacter baumannii 348935]